MAIRLPVETLIAIVKEVDDIQDLRHLRVASRALCAVATPLAFPALSVITTSSSANNLGRLLDLPHIAAHVKEVSYQDTGADRSGKMLERVSTDDIDKLASSFYRIHQLPRLETIRLRFNAVYNNEIISDSEGHLFLQASILGALVDSFSVRAPSKLTSLSLLNLRASDPHPLETFPLQAILPTLRCLQLSAVFDSAPNPHSFHGRWRHFWSTLSRPLRMIPVQTQLDLTELTLHSDACVGTSDGLSLRELHFPRLSVLSLRNIVFNPIRDDEIFALRHAATLMRLELLTCKVLVGSNRAPAPAPSKYTNLAGEVALDLRAHWDRIWDRFTAELTALVSLYVDERHHDREYRYVYRRIGGSYKVTDVVGSRNAADLAALQRFRMAVAARSTEKGVES